MESNLHFLKTCVSINKCLVATTLEACSTSALQRITASSQTRAGAPGRIRVHTRCCRRYLTFRADTSFWPSSEQNKGQTSLVLLVCCIPRKSKVAYSRGERNNLWSFVKWSQFLAQQIMYEFMYFTYMNGRRKNSAVWEINLNVQDIQ